MRRVCTSLSVVVLTGMLVLTGCGSPPAQPTPTKAAAPAQAAEPTKAAEPAKAAAPTKPVEPTKAQAPSAGSGSGFPEKGKPVSVIVPWAAGGSPDLSGRLLASGLEKVLGTPVQVVNKGGAGSQVGLTDLARAKPDGYTIGITIHPTTNTTYLEKSRQATYDRKSFQPIALVDYDPYVVGVLPNSPYKTAKDLVDAAKAKPEQIKVALPGMLTGQHIAMIQWGKAAGVGFAPVQFDSGGQMLTAVLGGHVDCGIFGAGAVADQFRAGGVRLVAIQDTQESKFFPGVKTLESQGYRVTGLNMYGVSAPSGLPKPVVDRYITAIKQVVADPDYIGKIEKLARTMVFKDDVGYAKYWEEADGELAPLVASLETKK